MQSPDHEPLPTAPPGQYVVLRLQPAADGPPLFRSYSLSGPASAERCRITVKVEPNGVAGTWLREHIHVGDTLDVSSPRGSFILQSGERPVVLLSAGIGATPVLAMLYALAAARSTRRVLWVHAARIGSIIHFPPKSAASYSPFRTATVMFVTAGRARSTKWVRISTRPVTCRKSVLNEIGIPPEADVYLCGAARFMTDMKEALTASGVALERIHVKIFNGSQSVTPGVVGAESRAPHVPTDDANTGPLVSFARSGVAAHWKAPAFQSILELAEACGIPVRWSCRTGVCHTCESGLVSGAVVYEPEPPDKPADGDLLVCCSQPIRDVVIDL